MFHSALFHRVTGSFRRIGFVLIATVLVVAMLPGLGVAGTDQAPGQTSNEPTTTNVNPRNPAQVAVMRGCQVTISNDFGQTFPIIRNTTVSPCNGDAVATYDSQGRLFVTHLSRPGTEIHLFIGQVTDTTTAGTQNYTPIQVSATDTVSDDKQWLVADSNPSSPYADNIYVVWTRFSSPTQVMFSRSTDGGANWSAEQPISAGGEGFVWPAHLAVARNGDLYVAYHTDTCGAANAGTIELLRDGTGGAQFAAAAVPQKAAAFPAGTATVTCNVQDAPADEIAGTDFWLQGTMQPWVLPDPARPGNVYVVANDDPDNTYASGDDANVVISRSTDHGLTFSRSRVDHAPGTTFAVMPTAAIDQDGNIAVHWYDNRRGLMTTTPSVNPGGGANFLLDLYGTASKDGGASFVEDFRINDAPFNPDLNAPCRFGPGSCGAVAVNTTLRIGEYNGVWSVDGIGYAAWTGNVTPPGPTFPSDGSGGQQTVFDTFSMLGAFRDDFEPNESRDFAVVANLGAGSEYARERLTLHNDSDIDVFKVQALKTGTLAVTADFNEVLGNLEARIWDATGATPLDVSTDATLTPGSTVSTAAIPVVAGKSYFVDVRDQAAAGTFAPQSTYDLSITNTAAPVPFGLDLMTVNDTGRSQTDDLTNLATPQVQVRLDTTQLDADGIAFSPTPNATLTDDAPGYKVRVYSDGNSVGFAQPVGGQPGVFTLTTASLSDGARSLTARAVIVDPTGAVHNVGTSGESSILTVHVDTAAPAAPSTPDLKTQSDNAGITSDDVTMIMQPSFAGSAEANSLIRLFAGSEVVGTSLAGQDGSFGTANDGVGAYQLTSDPLDDAVYQVSVTAEDLAGNTSGASAGLQTVIANQVLNLTGVLSSTGPVTVNLTNNTAAPFPVPGGTVGITGIPTVVLDPATGPVTTLGTANDDTFQFTPTASDAGRLTRAGSSQVLRYTGITGGFLVDPLAGVDDVALMGTASSDAVTAVTNVTDTVQLGSWQMLSTPAASTEQLSVITGAGADVINVNAFNTVSERVYVNGGEPLPNKPNGDSLTVKAMSLKPRIKTQNGGLANGSIFVEYPQTTLTSTRIDFADVEKTRTLLK